mmetsp:Transcript_43049/g.100277  ORF Transcript_43049/g.100277 Transcript_43049/m.100277 type:complete len:109 (+) Transcript_43049:251-577(+)
MNSTRCPEVFACSSEKRPRSTIRPSATTATVSQLLTIGRLCVATKIVGRDGRGESTAWANSAAVTASSPDVGSSRSRTGASRIRARAKPKRWRSPPDRSSPPRPTGAS